jgi:hypothetical protein
MKKLQLTDDEYRKALEELSKVNSTKEARAYHKKYKKYGLGLFFLDRYPNFPLYVSCAALAISIIALIVRIAIE